MKKEFAPYELAVKLKELGFEESCLVGFDDDGDLHIQRVDFQSDIEGFCLAPTFSQAFRWFRDEHKLHHEIEYNGFEYLGYVSGMTANVFNTYEEAELACLNKLIEIVESKK